MPTPLSALGIFHTLVSILAIFVAIYILCKDYKIVPRTPSGNLYSLLNFLACASALGIFKQGSAGPGHALAVLSILSMTLAYYIKGPLQNILMTSTLLFSLIPATVETLTRLPLDAPWANSMEDPIVKKSLGALVFLFLLGIIAQLKYFKVAKK